MKPQGNPIPDLSGIKRPRPISNYSKAIKSGKMDLVFELLKPDPKKKPYKTLVSITVQTGIPTTTLQYWQDMRSRKDINFLPNRHRSKNLALSQEAEQYIYDQLYENYILPRKYCPKTVLRQIVEQCPIEKPAAFKASRHWETRFLQRHGLSIRKFHSKRRSDSVDEIVAEWMDKYFSCIRISQLVEIYLFPRSAYICNLGFICST